MGLLEDRTNAEFKPLHIASVSQVTKYRKKFLCAKKEDMYINGTYNSNQARLINIQLARCLDQDYCKPDMEITEALRNKFLLVLQN